MAGGVIEGKLGNPEGGGTAGSTGGTVGGGGTGGCPIATTTALTERMAKTTSEIRKRITSPPGTCTSRGGYAKQSCPQHAMGR